MKPFVDSILLKFFSRKLLVWVTATVAFFTGNLSADHWFAISSAYIGVEGFSDILMRFKDIGWSRKVEK